MESRSGWYLRGPVDCESGEVVCCSLWRGSRGSSASILNPSSDTTLATERMPVAGGKGLQLCYKKRRQMGPIGPFCGSQFMKLASEPLRSATKGGLVAPCTIVAHQNAVRPHCICDTHSCFPTNVCRHVALQCTPNPRCPSSYSLKFRRI